MSKRRKRETEHRFEERAKDMMNDAYWDGYEDAHADRSAPRKFRRNTIDGNVGGVCAGMADYFGWDLFLVRLLTVASFFFSAGNTLLVYLVLWVFVPRDNRAPYRREAREAERYARRRPHNEATPVRRKTESLTDVRSKFRSIETRMQELERNITSKEWQLRRDFRDLED